MTENAEFLAFVHELQTQSKLLTQALDDATALPKPDQEWVLIPVLLARTISTMLTLQGDLLIKLLEENESIMDEIEERINEGE